MKEKLIKLSKEKNFNSDFLHNEPYKYNTKENLRYYLWLCELQKWLREKHKIFIMINDSNGVLEQEHFRFQISELHKHNVYKMSCSAFNFGNKKEGNYTTYEEALEKAIFEALELIK